jgi:hypothetical protein
MDSEAPYQILRLTRAFSRMQKTTLPLLAAGTELLIALRIPHNFGPTLLKTGQHRNLPPGPAYGRAEQRHSPRSLSFFAKHLKQESL